MNTEEKPGRSKTKFIVAALAVLLLFMLFKGCNAVPKHSKYIPEDAMAVASLDLGSVLKKADYKELLKNKQIKEVLEILEQRGSPIVGWIKNPETTGIDYTGTMLLTLSQGKRHNTKFTAIIPLKSAKKLEAALRDWWKSELGEAPTLEKEDACTFVNPGKENEFQIAFNKTTLVIVLQDYGSIRKSSIEELFEQKKLPDLMGLKPWLKEKCDIGIWTNGEEMQHADHIGSLLNDDVAIGLGITFEKGRIEGVGTTYFEDGSYAKTGGKGVRSSLVKCLPRDSIAVGAISLDMEEFEDQLMEILSAIAMLDGTSLREINRDFREEIGLSIKDLLEIFKGDAVFAFSDLNFIEKRYGRHSYQAPKPSFVIAANLNNEENWETLYDTLDEEGVKEELALFERKDILYLCTDDLSRRVKSKGKAKKQVRRKTEKLLKKHHLAFRLDIERLVEAFKRSESIDSEDEMLNFLGYFKSLELTEDMGKKSGKIGLNVELSNKRENSLKTIVNGFLELHDD